MYNYNVTRQLKLMTPYITNKIIVLYLILLRLTPDSLVLFILNEYFINYFSLVSAVSFQYSRLHEKLWFQLR